MVDTLNWDDTQPVSAPTPQSNQNVDTSDVPTWDNSQDVQSQYGTPSEVAKTAVEQGLSGATLGLSKVAETKLGITTPEAIAGREAANPVTSVTSNIGGAVAGLLGPEEILAPVKGAQLLGKGIEGALGAGKLAKVAAGVGEGALIGGVNQVTDDWSQNKSLDAEKIAASTGFGALLGGGGAGLFEGLSSITSKSPIVNKAVQNLYGASTGVEAATEGAPILEGAEASPVVDAPSVGVKGVQPTTYQDIIDRVKQASYMGNQVELPQKAQLLDSLSRIEMENPVHPLQLDSLDSQQARDVYNTSKEMPGEIGDALKGLEAVQKNELISKTELTINALSPGITPTTNAIEGGKAAIDAFSDQYQAEKNALKPVFEILKASPISGDALTNGISKMTDAVPGVAEMFDTTGADIQIKPYKTSWGIDKATYSAVKEATEALKDNPNDFKSLWNIRKGLDQHIDVMAQGQAPSEIRALKAAMMDYMQSEAEQASPDINVREAFKRYAINEQQRGVIEKAFGASVGSPEFGAISKIKPEMIGDKIFANSANVNAAKQILPKEQFGQILANWISEGKAAATDKGAFSSNKFGSFLRKNEAALQTAFSDNPEQLQRLNDLTKIMRILPDSPSINPSGTAKTLIQQLKKTNFHDMTWEGMLASIPKKILTEMEGISQRSQLNQALAGKASVDKGTKTLMEHVEKTTNKIEKGARAIFTGSSSQARKVQH